MYYGLNNNNEKIHINNSIKREKYICPVCKGLLVRKCGSQKTHHFAHKTMACDSWYKDNKGEWHRNMQSHFKPEQCEVRIEDKNGNFHIADVFIKGEKHNTIIEFQHSYISQEEFETRNNFYSLNNCVIDNKGLKHINTVIWVFDCRKKNMYITLSNKKYDYEQNKAINDKMCKEYLESSFNRYKNIKFDDYDKTQKDIIPIKGLWAHIYWKRASKIFSNITRNVIVYFDVHQRKYVEGERESWNGYTNSFIKYLNEFDVYPSNKPFDDSLYDFMVYIENLDLKFSPEHTKGLVLPHQDFYNFYENYGNKV